VDAATFFIGLMPTVYALYFLTAVLKVKLNLSLCLTEHHAMKAYWVSGGIAPFFDLSNRWRRVVSFTPQPIYPHGRGPRYPFDRRLGGPQNRSGRGAMVLNDSTVGISQLI
jgi:hypothetical protein